MRSKLDVFEEEPIEMEKPNNQKGGENIDGNNTEENGNDDKESGGREEDGRSPVVVRDPPRPAHEPRARGGEKQDGADRG